MAVQWKEALVPEAQEPQDAKEPVDQAADEITQQPDEAPEDLEVTDDELGDAVKGGKKRDGSEARRF